MATLKEFEDALREQGMSMALAILERLRVRDRGQRSAALARRVVGRKMTPDLAQEIVRLHSSSNMTQQEIAFQLGINQGRVNEVIKRGKWLSGDPSSPEAGNRDRALAKIKGTASVARSGRASRSPASRPTLGARPTPAKPKRTGQLTLGDL